MNQGNTNCGDILPSIASTVNTLAPMFNRRGQETQLAIEEQRALQAQAQAEQEKKGANLMTWLFIGLLVVVLVILIKK